MVAVVLTGGSKGLGKVSQIWMNECCICRVGQNHIYAVFLAGKPPNIRSYTVYIYGSGQPYVYACQVYVQMTEGCGCGKGGLLFCLFVKPLCVSACIRTPDSQWFLP
jgi:hypothetical protein